MTDPLMKVIIAEDDEDDYFFMRDVFKEVSPQIKLTWVKDGAELIKFLTAGEHSNEDFKAILLDLNMPKKDGRQTLKEIRENLNIPNIPIIVFTTSNAMADVRYVESFKGTFFMTKPVSIANYQSFAKILPDIIRQKSESSSL